MAGKIYHVSQRKDGTWQVRAAKAIRALKRFPTQKEAIDFAKTVADNQEGSILIHKRDGKIRKTTYTYNDKEEKDEKEEV